MMGRPYIGRVGNLAVALGVGAAVFTGWGCAVASADSSGGETPSASDDRAGAGNDGAGTGRTDADAAKPVTQKADEPATAPRDEEADPANGHDADDASHSDTDTDADGRDVEDGRVDSRDNDGSNTDGDIPSSIDPTVDEKSPAAPSETSIESEVRVITSPVDTQPDPPAVDDAPAAPAVESHLWTLLAVARRELTNSSPAKSLRHTVDAQPIGQLVGAGADSVAAVSAAANSVTFTPPPTIFDRLVVAGFQLTRFISDILGVDLNALANGLISSERPPWFVRTGLDVRSTKYGVADGSEWTVWEFHPPSPTGKTVVAFHGGGYVEQPNVLLWSDYSKMAKETGATVLVPLYPLATTEAGRATKVIPAAADFVSDQIELHGAENVSVYGDSAGSALAIGAVRLLVLAGKAVPASIVLLSLTADGSLKNPDIRAIDDPIFNIDNLDAYQSHWFDGIDGDDPLASPLFAEPEVFQALPPTTLYVGQREILYPDNLLLQQKWSAAGGSVSTVVGQGLTHDWALSTMFFTQSRAVRPDIYRQLGLNSVAAGPTTIATEPPSFTDQLFVAGARDSAILLRPHRHQPVRVADRRS